MLIVITIGTMVWIVVEGCAGNFLSPYACRHPWQGYPNPPIESSFSPPSLHKQVLFIPPEIRINTSLDRGGGGCTRGKRRVSRRRTTPGYRLGFLT